MEHLMEFAETVEVCFVEPAQRRTSPPTWAHVLEYGMQFLKFMLACYQVIEWINLG